MKTLIAFLMISNIAMAAPRNTPDATELKIRATWADYYSKKGYDFDIQKMTVADMDTAFKKAEAQKKNAEIQKVETAKKAEEAKRAHSKLLEDQAEFLNKEGVLLSPKEIELRKLEAEHKRLYAVYKNEPNAVNYGRWNEALSKMLKLKWQIYPSTAPKGGKSNTTLDEIEDRLDAIDSKLE